MSAVRARGAPDMLRMTGGAAGCRIAKASRMNLGGGLTPGPNPSGSEAGRQGPGVDGHAADTRNGFHLIPAARDIGTYGRGGKHG